MSKKCCKCQQVIDKQDTICIYCNAEQLQQTGMFGWSVLGFFIGWVLPYIAGLLITMLITDKHVAEHFLDMTMLNRSRWSATRKGMIAGIISKLLIFILLFGGCVYTLYWFANGLGG